MKKKIHLLEPSILNVQELDFETFFSQKLQDPNFHQSFYESQLELYLKTEKKVCVLNSGSSAIHMALILSNVCKGDVVFCSNSTFIATVNPILYLKAKPYFIDIDYETGNMNMDYLEAAIIKVVESGQSVKAVIVTHSYGVPAEMDKLMRIKKKYNISIIEDAAEALGSMYNNLHCGTISDFGILSFNTNKMNTTFGGGAIIVNDFETKRIVQKLSTHYKNQYFDFKHLKLGYNYRMNDVAAYVGSKQLSLLDKVINKKKEIHEKYLSLLGDALINVELPNITPNNWLNCLKIYPNTFEFVFDKFQQRGIEIRRVWYPLNKQDFLLEYEYYGNNEALKFYEEVICLPSTINLSNREINKIVSVINDI